MKKDKKPEQISKRPSAALPSVPIEAVFSFLKGTKGSSSWTKQEFAKALKINAADAAKVLPVIQMQGYIHPYHDDWVTTTAGEDVSGARPPRFSPAKVEEALADLRTRIKAVNLDKKVPYRITAAVAFGDFLDNKTRVQAGDVGIRLEPRKPRPRGSPVRERAAEAAFFRQLRGKSAMLHLAPYEEWMSMRTNRRLL